MMHTVGAAAGRGFGARAFSGSARLRRGGTRRGRPRDREGACARSTGAEQSDRKLCNRHLPIEPTDCIDQALGQQRDIKDVGPVGFLPIDRTTAARCPDRSMRWRRYCYADSSTAAMRERDERLSIFGIPKLPATPSGENTDIRISWPFPGALRGAVVRLIIAPSSSTRNAAERREHRGRRHW